MCYLITYYKPVKTTELNVLQTQEFEDEFEAKQAAENLILNDCMGVRLWSLLATPVITRKVDWQDG